MKINLALRRVSSAVTRYCKAQPPFFDGALPAIILFLALLTQFTQVRISRFRDNLTLATAPNTSYKLRFS